jgi:twitching motility two-component system response regulator PilG
MVGSDEYLTKPFSKENLLKAVEAHLASSGEAQARLDNAPLSP